MKQWACALACSSRAWSSCAAFAIRTCGQRTISTMRILPSLMASVPVALSLYSSSAMLARSQTARYVRWWQDISEATISVSGLWRDSSPLNTAGDEPSIEGLPLKRTANARDSFSLPCSSCSLPPLQCSVPSNMCCCAISSSADGDDDLDPIPGRELGPRVLAARNDLAVALDRHPLARCAQLGQQVSHRAAVPHTSDFPVYADFHGRRLIHCQNLFRNPRWSRPRPGGLSRYARALETAFR